MRGSSRAGNSIESPGAHPGRAAESRTAGAGGAEVLISRRGVSRLRGYPIKKESGPDKKRRAGNCTPLSVLFFLRPGIFFVIPLNRAGRKAARDWLSACYALPTRPTNEVGEEAFSARVSGFRSNFIEPPFGECVPIPERYPLALHSPRPLPGASRRRCDAPPADPLKVSSDSPINIRVGACVINI